MAVPFPSPTFPANYTPYPLVAFVDPFQNTSAKNAWLQTPAPANAFYFDETTLRAHVATAISVSGTPPWLHITAEGTAFTFDLSPASGDGTGRIPVGIIDP